MKKTLAVITASLLMLSTTAFAKHYVLVDNSGYGPPVLYKYHKVHYYQMNPGYYYMESRPKIKRVIFDPYSGQYVVLHKRHPIYVVNYQPTPAFQLNF